MSTFTVTVKTESERFEYTAIALSSSDADMRAIEEFGVCAVTVKPAGERHA